MSDVWHVYKKDGAELGLLTPAEIRQALREGRVDPFDQVCRQGSNVRLELVEVDEIFAEEGAESGGRERDSVYDAAEATDTKAEEGLFEESDEDEDIGSRTTVSRGVGEAKAPEKAATGFTPKSGETEAKRKKAGLKAKKKLRRYHLMDKRKRLLGPLSAAEIQSLFYRGILEKNVKVAKDRDGKKVPIAQFVAAYVGEKAKKFESENTRIDLDPGEAAQMGFPSSKVMDQMTRTISPATPVNRLVPVVSIAIMAVLVVIAYFAVSRILTEHGKRKQERSRAEQSQLAQELDSDKEVPAARLAPPPPKEVVAQKPAPVVTKPAPEKVVVKPRPAPRASRPVVSEPAPAPVVTRRADPPRPPARRPAVEIEAATPRTSRAETAKLSRPGPRLQVSRPVPQGPKAEPAAQPQPTKLAAKTAASPASDGGGLDDKVGSVAALSGMTFSKEALAQCAIKCSLNFKDARGTKVQALFFKGQYEEKLAKAAGPVTISGRIAKQGGGYVIYLNGIK